MSSNNINSIYQLKENERLSLIEEKNNKTSLDENTVNFHYFLNTDFTKKFEKNKIKFPKSIAVSENPPEQLVKKMADNIGLCGGIIGHDYAKDKAKSAYGLLIVEPKNSINNEPVGISIVNIYNKNSLYVEILCSTQPNYSRVGTVMMKQLFKLSFINNFKYITLDAIEEAVPFYKKMGFTSYKSVKSVKSLLLDDDSDDEYDDETDDGLIPMRIKVKTINNMNSADKEKFFVNFADKKTFFNNLMKINYFRQKPKTIINLQKSNQNTKNPVTNRVPRTSLTLTSQKGYLGGRKNTKRKRRRSNKTKKTK